MMNQQITIEDIHEAMMLVEENERENGYYCEECETKKGSYMFIGYFGCKCGKWREYI
jgi:hypothetical protein